MNTAATTTKKPANKVVTVRFTLNPSMEAILVGLQRRYSMLDKTEIVKVALSTLATKEKIDELGQDIDLDNSVSSNAFTTEEDYYTWWNNNKTKLRV